MTTPMHDVADAIAAGITDEDLLGRIHPVLGTLGESALPSAMDDAPPAVMVVPLDRSVVDRVIDVYTGAQAQRPSVFRRGNRIVQVQGGQITLVGRGEFRVDLSKRVICLKPDKDDGPPIPRLPQHELSDLLFYDPSIALPELKGITRVPLFTGHDWVLRDTPGYSAEDGWILLPSFRSLPVPEIPGDDDIAQARHLIDVELLGDFCYETATDKVAHVGLMITTVVRNQIDGCVPAWVFEAPSAGAGKGLGAAVAFAPAFGGEGDGIRSVPYPLGEEERRKAITTYLAEGWNALRWDNVDVVINSASFAKLLTDRVWSDRRLGGNSGISVPAMAIHALTAINPAFSTEMIRRIIPVRQVPNVERPEDRRDFRHPELLQWAMAERPRLLWALHVMIRHWLALGRPGLGPEVPAFGSFENWRRVVGGILMSCGYHGLLANRERLRTNSDPGASIWSDFVGAWHHQFLASTRSARELLALAVEANLPLGGDNEQAKASSLAMLLSQRRDSIVSGFRIHKGVGRDRRKWCLSPVEVENRSDTCDTCDTSPQPSINGNEDGDNSEAGVEGVTPVTGVTEGNLNLPLEAARNTRHPYQSVPF